ncbi:unnamed protein product, partial [Brachionus calyciflorus]
DFEEESTFKKSRSKKQKRFDEKYFQESDKEEIDSSIQEKLNISKDKLVSSEFQTILFTNLVFNEFIRRTLSNGGGVVLENSKTNISIINTCTIDYYLFGLWYASKIRLDFKLQIDQLRLENYRLFLKIIENIESKKWNMAKTNWVLNVLNLNSDENGDYNLFEGEYAYCIRYFTCYQYFYAYSERKCGRKHNFEGETISFIKDKNQVNISIQKAICHNQNCESIIDVGCEFLYVPPFIVIENNFNHQIKCKELDKKMKINNFEYVLVFCTVFLREVAGGNYISIFNINDELHLVNP